MDGGILDDTDHADDPLETGWYRDPGHPDRHRFWDGERWQTQAEHLHDTPPAEQGANPDPTDGS